LCFCPPPPPPPPSLSLKKLSHRVYPRPLASRAGQGRYALMGHQPKPGTAPMPPAIRPSTHLMRERVGCVGVEK